MKLNDKSTSIIFYDRRYSKGYMNEDQIGKKQRVFEILKSLDLPESGEALDFGCGNGVYTEIIKKVLPKWSVYGTDISHVAIRNAKKRVHDCTFFVSSDQNFGDKKFDFLFSHHVLEHVYNIFEVLDEINKFMKPCSNFLHILPCGNEGSFEHTICLLKKDGIDKQSENRFFFEDPGHIRRLTTQQLTAMIAKFGFNLSYEYYSNQYYGAINWITKSDPKLVLDITSSTNARNKESIAKLRSLRIKLLLLTCLRLPAVVIEKLKRKRTRIVRHYFLFTLAIIFYPFSQPIHFYLENKAKLEWKNRKNDTKGSEMHLCYSRSSSFLANDT